MPRAGQCKPIEERYWAKVDASGGPDACWPWTGVLLNGYGSFWTGTYHESGVTRKMGAHRWAYGHFVRPLGPEDHVLHRCDNPPCQNLNHLFIGTHAENMADRNEKGRHRSPRGTGRPVLEAWEALILRAEHAEGLSYRELGRRYGISPCTARQIVRRDTWKTVEADVISPAIVMALTDSPDLSIRLGQLLRQQLADA